MTVATPPIIPTGGRLFHHLPHTQNYTMPTTSIPGAQEGQLTAVDDLREIIETTFPTDEIDFAFGYGSGVLSQQLATSEGDDETKVIDLILAVKDSRQFHKDNLYMNPGHYAVPSLLGKGDTAARYATWLQRHNVDNTFCRNPRVYFNVTRRIKYGVIQVQDMAADLKEWKYLYVAGRMHKPIVTIIDKSLATGQATQSRSSLQYAQDNHNLPAALSTALLLLSADSSLAVATKPISEAAVYQQIASLSYTGDFRTAVGAEDPRKIQKLVESPGQLMRFRDLYATQTEKLCRAGILNQDAATGMWSWDTSPTARLHLWKALPPSLRVLRNEDNVQAACMQLAAALPAIVAPSARYQSAKGLFTAGVRRSAKYAARKFSKGLSSK